ncbi:hypothetical protein CTAYLR_006355 [Chrysophaeum taylorii]|uniref:Extradiol ring-cleavage dioxygenase class III enzyme subunit B domain-containing protein n=1 Tax=Chrysophaeum taylorii TaxID=2483200 RepID=A0AAD7XFA0_9STRA|nr:hypothetical protein CTAYLR_006355 [Chrysophaeum taylorii]
MATLYVAHGGGPMPVMGADPVTRRHLESIAGETLRPEAIVCVTAHWEADPIRVSAHPAPPLLFDYGGFPKETYEYEYAARGNPGLALRIRDLLVEAGLGCELDETRGIDHGVFVPLMLAYPEADVPVVAVSIHASLDPSIHLGLGRALAPLRDDGVLVLCSGMSFHNFDGFDFGGQFANFRNTSGMKRPTGAAWDAALADAVFDVQNRAKRLAEWRSLPEADWAHPRGAEDHFVPLLVAAGAAEHDHAHRIFDGAILGTKVSAYRFGGSSG